MSVFHQNILAGASGASGADAATYVDDVFSTFLYTGTGASHTIANGIDLSGEGGLVWIKQRNTSIEHFLFDTERGATKSLSSNDNTSEYTSSTTLTGFGSTGFTLSSSNFVNGTTSSPRNYCSWTFRKAPGFFDVVTYTGNGTAGRTVSHNLGSTPGAIIIKKTSNSENWIVYHRSVGATKFLKLNETGAAATSSVIFNNTEPTSTEFTLGVNSQVNENGDTYVAYVFAHDDQSFGTDEDEAIIKCGSYTGGGSSDVFVDLGFEPQWVMIKSASQSSNWTIADSMRGITSGGNDVALKANANDADQSYDFMRLNPTGFTMNNLYGDTNNTSQTYIYIAIRRPHKPPTAGTDVFTADAAGLNPGTSNSLLFEADHVVDLCIHRHRTSSGASTLVFDRVRGSGQRLYTNDNSAEGSLTNFGFFDFQEGVGSGSSSGNASSHVAWMFKRAPGFLDIVGWSGTGADQVVNHGLGVTPELMFLKCKSSATGWRGFYKDGSTEKNITLSSNAAASTISASHPWSPTSTTFRADQYFSLSQSGQTFIAYAFATLAGISKVGLYSGSDSAQNIDCGFTNGARFVLIKRTDSNRDWFVWDHARGIVAGNDPYLRLNLTNVENSNSDLIDPYSAGFTVNGGVASTNASGGTFLFLAIA